MFFFFVILIFLCFFFLLHKYCFIIILFIFGVVSIFFCLFFVYFLGLFGEIFTLSFVFISMYTYIKHLFRKCIKNNGLLIGRLSLFLQTKRNETKRNETIQHDFTITSQLFILFSILIIKENLPTN